MSFKPKRSGIHAAILAGAGIIVLFPLVCAAAAGTAGPAAQPAAGAPPQEGEPRPLFFPSGQAAPQSAASAESRIVKLTAPPDGAPQRLALALNKAAIVELDTDARDVFVANPQIVDAVVRTPRRIFLMSLKLGQTNAIFLDTAGKHIGTLEINVGSDVADLNEQFARQFQGSKIHAEAINDNIVLSGTVASVQQAGYAQSMAARLTGDPLKVVNMLSIGQRQQVLINVRVSEMGRTIAKQFGMNMDGALRVAGVPMALGTGNQFSLLGRALSDLSGAGVGQVCPANFYGRGTGTINSSQSAGGTTITTVTNGIPDITSTVTSAGALTSAMNIPTCTSANNVQGVLRALERIGLVRSLAEPNLTAISGESAKFLAGGEFPVPTSRDLYGNPVVTFKQYGVGLAFTPVVLNGGRISLQISSEVSELSSEGAFVLSATQNAQGLQVPGLTVRRTETTVEMPSGGSLVIGGLLQQKTKQNIDAFPGLKELPVLGALFRSRDFQNNESELVVMVTAYLVDPVQAAQLTAPDAGFAIPSDLETVLLGRVNAVYGKQAKQPGEAPGNTIGYIVQ